MKKILVVDDQPGCVKMLTGRLEANNYKVVCAFNGEEALVKVKEEIPDLIITDVLMPRMDGYTLVRELKKTGSNVPIIIVTSRTEMSELFELEGVCDYLIKPFDAKELMEKVNGYLK